MCNMMYPFLTLSLSVPETVVMLYVDKLQGQGQGQGLRIPY